MHNAKTILLKVTNEKNRSTISGCGRRIQVVLGLVSAIALSHPTGAIAQTAIDSLTGGYQLGTSTSYSTTVANPCDTVDYSGCDDPITLNFGVGATNDLTITGFQAGGDAYSLLQLADKIEFQRIDGLGGTGERQLMFFELSGSAGDQIRTSYTNDMEVGLLSDVVNRGLDNTFSNDNGRASNNIERIDYVVSNGLSVPASNQSGIGFLVLERGGNDPFKVAAITSLDTNGDPASYGPLLNVTNANWGDSGFAAEVAVMRREEAEPAFRPSHIVSSQSIEGVFLSLEDMSAAPGQTIFGYSLFPNDISNSSTSSDLVNLINFPTNTSGSSGQGGLDLVAGGGIYLADGFHTVSGTLYEDANTDDNFTSGEPTLPDGVEVVLYQDGNGNSEYDAGEEIQTTNTTDGNGSYSFLAVVDDTYRIFVDTGDADIPTDLALGTPNDVSVVVAGSDQTGIDFGFDDTSLPPATGGSCEVILVNGGFEAPVVGTTPPTPTNTFNAGRIVIYNENDVPGWSSSADDSIEIWRTDNTISGPSLEDQQFAEINAFIAGSLFQDVPTTPGAVLTWQFAHRGRSGVDTLNLKIGPPGSTVTQVNPTTGTPAFTTDNTDWVQYQGTYVVPAGQTVTRFEYEAVSTANSDNSTGNFLDAVRFGPLCDHGDADASYPVLRAAGGAAHVNDGVTFLGSALAIETDGQPSANADGDDGVAADTDGNDDEDGVTFAAGLDAGTSVTIDVVASVAAPLNAWIDFNADGDWDDDGEQIFTNEPLSAGSNTLSVAVPSGATLGNTFARFRLSPQSDLLPTGIVGGGEVEDYRVAITVPAAGPTFACDTSAYAVIGTPSSFNIFDPDPSALSFTPVATPTRPELSVPIRVNGLSFNPLDNYIYAQVNNTQSQPGFAQREFVRISADGVIENLELPALPGDPSATITNGSTANGVMDASGNYYYIANSSTLRVVAIGDTPAAGSLTFEDRPISGLTGGVNDLNFNPVDGFLYGIRGGVLFRINPAGGAVTPVTITGATLPTAAGGSWATSSGISYFYQNGGSGNALFAIDLTQVPALVTNVGPVDGNGQFDAASCTPPAITKNANVDTSAPGGVVSYTYQIFNGFGTAIMVNFDDILTDANISFDTNSLSSPSPGGGAVTTFTGNQLSIGGISIPTGVGGSTNSVTFTADVNVSSSAPVGFIDNQAQVTFGPARFPSDDPDTGDIDDPTTFEVLAGTPEIFLTKRITAINRGLADEQIFDDLLNNPQYVNVGTATDSDNNVNWPGGTALVSGGGGGTVESYIVGITGIDDASAAVGFTTKPQDTLEYTISFLSDGNVAADDVYVCDRIPANTTFDPTAFNGAAPAAAGPGNRGILLSFDGQDIALTNASDGDEIADTGGNDNGVGGYYFLPGVDPSIALGMSINCGGTNDNGAIVVDLSDIPNATGDGVPLNSHGFIRFRAVVD